MLEQLRTLGESLMGPDLDIDALKGDSHEADKGHSGGWRPPWQRTRDKAAKVDLSACNTWTCRNSQC
jgi:hypothetical protein